MSPMAIVRAGSFISLIRSIGSRRYRQADERWSMVARRIGWQKGRMEGGQEGKEGWRAGGQGGRGGREGAGCRVILVMNLHLCFSSNLETNPHDLVAS
jgi:hypothetical protein